MRKLKLRCTWRWTGPSRIRPGRARSGTIRSRRCRRSTCSPSDALLLGRVTYEGFAASWFETRPAAALSLAEPTATDSGITVLTYTRAA